MPRTPNRQEQEALLAKVREAGVEQALATWPNAEDVAEYRRTHAQRAPGGSDAKLVAAYHTIFDVKDNADVGGVEWIACYHALSGVADLLRARGVAVPDRYDAPRES